MSLFSLANLSIALLCISLAFVILPQAKNYAHRIWAIFNIILAFWALGLYFVGITDTSEKSIFFWKWTFVPNTFIPVLFYHLIHAYCNLKDKKFLILVYILGLSFIPAIFANYFISESVLLFNSIYYFKPTTVFVLWSIFFISVTAIAFQRLFVFIQQLHDTESRREAMYLFWGGILGFMGGTMTTVLPLLGVKIYPVWHFSVAVYVAVVTFAILRHKIFDLQVTLIRSLVPVSVFILAIYIFCFTHFKMNLFALASLSLGVACLLLAYLIFAYAKQKMHRIWAIFNLCLSVWGIGTFIAGVSADYINAWVGWKIAYVGVLLVSVFFYHMIYIFCGLTNRKILQLAYVQGVVFVFLTVATNLFINKLEYLFDSFYYNKATGTYLIVFILWMVIVVLAFWELFNFMKVSKGIQRTQAQYLFWGMLLGFTGGTSVVIPAFGIKFYPYGHFFICIYAGICTYAIFRYQLMDISIAVTRIGVFVVVYSLVLGVPFGLAILGKPWLMALLGENWFWLPMLTLLTLATLGPFAFLYFQRKAEDALLQEERRIQWLLKRASVGMSSIRDVQKLLGLIVDVLVKNLHLEHAAVYLFESNEGGYILKASEPKNENAKLLLNYNTPLIQRLKEKKYPILYDEMNHLVDNQKEGSSEIKEIITQMQALSAVVIVPAMKENMLLGFIAMGKRKEKETYSPELLDVLAIIGNDAAVNIENAMYIEAENKRLEEEGKNIRRMHLDTMVSTIAHEINNPMHIIDGEMGTLLQICEGDGSFAVEDLKPLVIKKAKKMRDIAQGVSHLVNNIRNFSKGQIHVGPLKIEDLMDSASVFIKYELKEHPNVKYTVNIQKNLPHITADMNMVIEILRNFVSNAVHATRRNTGPKEVALNISRLNGQFVRFEVVDNGYGINEETKKKLFETTYTSKSHTEGTGLGLWRIRKVCEFLRASYGFDSPGKNLGSRFWVDLKITEG